MYTAKLGKRIEMEKGKEEGNMRISLCLIVLISLLGSLLEYLTHDSVCLCQFPDVTFVKLEVHLACLEHIYLGLDVN